MFDIQQRRSTSGENVAGRRQDGKTWRSMPPKELRTERIAVRVTPELHAAIARVAERERRTVSNWINLVLETAVANAETPPTKKR
jgi:predicted HicB family RNase H-like nuclease